MAAGSSSIHELGVDILATTRDDGTTNSITAQLGDVNSEQAYAQNAEWIQHVGFCSRPSKPVPNQQAAQAYCITHSSSNVCFGSRDMRGQALYANLAEGETAIYAGGADGNAQGRVVCKSDGSVTLYTTSNNKPTGGSGMYLRLGPDGFRIETPFGRIVMDATGIHMIHASGARFDLGGIGGLPSPLDKVSSYATITAAVAHINGGVSTLLGPNPTQQAVGTTGLPVVPLVVATSGGPGTVPLAAGSGSVMVTP